MQALDAGAVVMDFSVATAVKFTNEQSSVREFCRMLFTEES